jgi:hypothetical protein
MIKDRIIESTFRLLREFDREEAKPRISSYPFISGDGLMLACDKALLSQNSEWVDIRNKSTGKVVFCDIDRLPELRDMSFEDIQTIVLHNSDRQIDEWEIRFLEGKVEAVFAANVVKETRFLRWLPTGLENVYRGNNGSIHYYNALSLEGRNHKCETIKTLASFRVQTNPRKRKEAEVICAQYGHPNRMFSRSQYIRELSESHFVICPAGNGSDCHRTWEAIYHNAVPIMLKDNRLCCSEDLPIVYVEAWEEFFMMSEDEKHEVFSQVSARTYPAIYLDYWIMLIRSYRSNSVR